MILIVQPAARSDILHQIGYYGDLQRPDVAQRFLSAVQFSIGSLEKSPFTGSPRHVDHEWLQGLRTWPVKGFDDFRIYYLTQGDILTVLRILHGRRDIDGVLGDVDDLDN